MNYLLPILRFKIKTILSNEGVRRRIADSVERPIGLGFWEFLRYYPLFDRNRVSIVDVKGFLHYDFPNRKPFMGAVDAKGFKMRRLYRRPFAEHLMIKPEAFWIIGNITPDGIHVTVQPTAWGAIGTILLLVFALSLTIIICYPLAVYQHFALSVFLMLPIGYILYLILFRIRTREVRSTLQSLLT